METKFKLGDEVYDSFEFPNEKGNIKSLGYDLNGLAIAVVQFEKEESVYKRKHLHRLSFTPYELKGFTQERPWQPKEGEWIAVRNQEYEKWRIVKFKEILGCLYYSQNEKWQFAKPLTDFINENL